MTSDDAPCSVLAAQLDVPVVGTAPAARSWVALEQGGPWGRRALVQSRLDPALGAALRDACSGHGGRALLIRRTGAHADSDDRPLRQVLVAGGLTGRPWLLSGQVSDPALVLDLPFADLAEGDAGPVLGQVPWLQPAPGPVLLVCTNAKRDACCARWGRPVANEVEGLRPGQVWECTHTGGHRFAPTGIVLPTGQALARLDPELAVAALDAAARDDLAPASLDPVHDRGRSHLGKAAQVAESWVRNRVGEHGLTALTVAEQRDERPDGGVEVLVRHRDGRSWLLRVGKEPLGIERPASCGAEPIPVTRWTVVRITAAAW